MIDPPNSGAQRLVIILREFAIASRRWIDKTSARNNMHRTDLDALVALMRSEHDGEDCTPSRLANELGITRAAATALIDRLEGAGHAERYRSGTDRRQVLVSMTDKAHREAYRMFAPMGDRLQALVDDMSEVERDAVSRFLTEAASIMEEFATLDTPPVTVAESDKPPNWS